MLFPVYRFAGLHRLSALFARLQKCQMDADPDRSALSRSGINRGLLPLPSLPNCCVPDGHWRQFRF